jgi:two-component system, NarL family, nitrate/nitrite response regulator NarL
LGDRTGVTLRCLLVDDSAEFLASATLLLESQGAQIVGAATNSDDALQLAAALEPELALVDVELADEDGIALAAALQARAPSMRVVLISAYERDELRELVSDSAAVGFLPKRTLGVDAIRRLLPR